MTHERFRHARLNIARAETHATDFERARDGFLRSSPYAIREEQDSRTGKYRHCFRFSRDTAPDMANLTIIAGDAIHNARGALDYLVSEIVTERVRARLVAE